MRSPSCCPARQLQTLTCQRSATLLLAETTSGAYSCEPHMFQCRTLSRRGVIAWNALCRAERREYAGALTARPLTPPVRCSPAAAWPRTCVRRGCPGALPPWPLSRSWPRCWREATAAAVGPPHLRSRPEAAGRSACTTPPGGCFSSAWTASGVIICRTSWPVAPAMGPRSLHFDGSFLTGRGRKPCRVNFQQSRSQTIGSLLPACILLGVAS